MSVLLLGGDDYGALAAARCFGRHGMDVAVASERRVARASFSRYTRVRLRHPPVSSQAALVAWLLTWGERNPDTLLYPSNDHLAWLFASERDRLGDAFTMLSPGERTIVTLLDKSRLYRACDELGIEVPETRLLGRGLREREASAVAAEIGYPVILKPRTQAYLTSGIKGFIARDPHELVRGRSRFHRLARFDPTFAARYPEISDPMVQRYLPSAETLTLSVAGFVGESEQLVARAATKVLQQPRKLGIGLCFEAREPDDVVMREIAALCRKVGYRGAFECEFVVDGARRVLIDFNPRFYSQMAFEMARGLRIPLLVWHAARGERAQLEAELARARRRQTSGAEIYCHKALLELMLTLQGAARRMSPDEVRRWRAWHARGKSLHAATDAVDDPDDRMPARVDMLNWALHIARHPRSFANGFVLNR